MAHDCKHIATNYDPTSLSTSSMQWRLAIPLLGEQAQAGVGPRSERRSEGGHDELSNVIVVDDDTAPLAPVLSVSLIRLSVRGPFSS